MKTHPLLQFNFLCDPASVLQGQRSYFLWAWLTSFALLSSIVLCNPSHAASPVANPVESTAPPVFFLTPNVMTQCENGQCSTWTFEPNGRVGTGQWQNGTSAKLVVERFQANDIVITRTDTVGASIGLTARYTGKVDGNRIVGAVVWSWPAVWGKQFPQGTWYASFSPLRNIPYQSEPTKDKENESDNPDAPDSTATIKKHKGPRNSAAFLNRQKSLQDKLLAPPLKP